MLTNEGGEGDSLVKGDTAHVGVEGDAALGGGGGHMEGEITEGTAH